MSRKHFLSAQKPGTTEKIEALEKRQLLSSAVIAVLGTHGSIAYLQTNHQTVKHQAVALKTAAKQAALKASVSKGASPAPVASKTVAGVSLATAAPSTTSSSTKSIAPGPSLPAAKGITGAGQTGVQSLTLGQQPGAANTTQFHGDAARTGFNQTETVLNSSNVASSFGQVWQSPVLDGRVYATPTYADSLTISGSGNAANFGGDGVQSPSFQGKSLGLVFAATGGGSVYAIAAQDTNGPTGIAPGTIVWKTHLGNPYGSVDGNSIGVLSTPIIDLKAGRIYVTASVTDYLSPAGTPNHGGNNFEVFALNLRDGSVVSGFPLIFTQTLLDSLNQNNLQSLHVAVPFSSGGGADQRGALNLNSDGSTLYVDWACYGASNPGWMTTVATGVSNGVANGQTPVIVSSFSAVDTTATNANGGLWGAGGPAIDANGNVFVSSGDSPGGTGNPLGDYGNSVLEFGPGQTLSLTGLYSPWNYPTQDTIDSDLGGSSPILITLPTGSSTTTELLATGGKQGNGYLLDAGNNLNNPTATPTLGWTGNGTNTTNPSYPADLTKRPPGGLQPDQDPGLYDTSAAGYRTYFTSSDGRTALPPQPGPLALFGPYNETSASNNTAKARDTPATFTGPDGTRYVLWAGSSKAGVGSSTPVAPSVYLTKVVAIAGQPAYLQVVAQNTAVMSNTGASIVTADGTSNEIEWIVDAGVQRGDSLGPSQSFSNGAPVLYAYDALTLKPIWSSSYEQLDMGGKYNSIADARGNIFVGTDRIQAFGLTSNKIVDDSVGGTGLNQFNYSGGGWQHLTGSATMGTFNGTVSTDNVVGDSATVSFTGSQINLYSNEMSSFGTATVTVDGGSSQTVSLTPTNSSPNGQGAGNALVYSLSGLGAGLHTLKIVNASGTISIDRVETTPFTTTSSTLGLSLTDGAVQPSAGSVIPYTINYNNAGSIVSGTGVNATGVVITETVPANTTADLANSTSGWTLSSGSGGPGSTYTFAVGPLNAGVTGSVVFSVDLNSSIPAGTSSVVNNISILDAASDNASAARSTALGSPVETRLGFTQQPPTNGSAGVALSPPIMVAAQDQFGNTFNDSTSTVTLTLSSGTFTGGSTTATARLVNGVATFNNLAVTAAGTYTVTASDGSLAGTTSTSFTIAPAAKVGFVQQPTQTVAGVAISPAVEVAIQDFSGTTVATDNSIVTLTLSSGRFANGSSTVTAQASGGVASFSNLVINSAAKGYTLTASDGTLAAAQSSAFDVVAIGSRLAFTQQPENTNAGEVLNPSVAVAVEDAFGNIDQSSSAPVTLTLSGGTFLGGSASVTANAVNGVATFDNLVIPAAGDYSISAGGGGFAPASSFSFNIGTRALTAIDDNNSNNTGATPQVTYTGAWTRSATALANNFDGTITSSSTANDTVSVTFTGTLISLYAARTPGSGKASVAIDGGSASTLDLYSSVSSIAPVYTSGFLGTSSHTLVLTVLGVNSGQAGAGSGNNVSLDKLVVGPATPTVVWATPADLTYGTALDGTQLDAFVSNVAGFKSTSTYSPGAGTVLGVGQNQLLSVTITPTDLTDYNVANAGALINVTKSTPVITWLEPAALQYGQTIPASALNATVAGNIAGTFTYSVNVGQYPNGSTTTPAPVKDNYPLSVTFTPSDTVDYSTVTYNTNVDVTKATPIITWPNPADITDGTSLSSAQLNATANTPGTFAYNPAAGTTLSVGPQQILSVTFTPNDGLDYSPVIASTSLNVVYGPATKLGFKQQPTDTKSGGIISPSVTVAVQDAAGSTLASDNGDVVTLALSSGTFASGSATATATVANGLATFSNLAITVNGNYNLSATDPGLTAAASNTFNVGTAIYDNFNNGAPSFSNFFATTFQSNNSAVSGNPSFTWNSTGGVNDGDVGGPGGGIVAAASTTDETAIYTPATVDLSDHATHTASMFVTDPSGLNSGDRFLQLGFVGSTSSGLNSGYSFISARLLGDNTVMFQAANAGGTTNGTPVAATITRGDWVQLIFTAQETASGSFQGTFSVEDYGVNGVGVPTQALAPVSWSVTGLTTLGTGTGLYGAFRSATGGEFTSPLAFDNFAVDQPPFKLDFLQPPTTGTTGQPLASPLVVAVEDINGNIVAGDSSTVTISTRGQGLFNGSAGTLSAVAVNGIANFGNVSITPAGSYSIAATDSNPNNLDLGFAPISIFNPPAKLAITQQPTDAQVRATLNPAVSVSVEDSNGKVVAIDTSTVTLTLNGGTFADGSKTETATAVAGVASFGSLSINTPGSYTLSVSDASLTGATSSSFNISDYASSLAFVQQPQGGLTGSAISPAVTVAVEDPAGNVFTGGGSTVVTLTLSGATFANNQTTATANVVQGIATFGNLVINTPGTGLKLTAADGPLTGAVSNSFAITDSPTKVGFVQQPTGANAGATFSPVTVAVQDPNGNTVATDNTSTVTLTLNGGSFTSGSTTTVKVVNGVATFNNLAVNTAGTGYTISAVDGSLTSATSSAFNITDVASKLAFGVQPTGSNAGATISPAVTVLIQDPAGNSFTSGANSIVTLTLSSGSFAGGGNIATATTVNGVATFSNLAINTAGSGYTLTATDGALTYALSNPFTVTDVPSKLVFQPQPTGANAGTALPTVSVVVQDPAGSTYNDNTSTVTLTLNGGTFANGLSSVTAAVQAGVARFSQPLVINKPGNYTFTATDGSLPGVTSAQFTISSTPTQLVYLQQPTNANAGAVITPAVRLAVEDPAGNLVTSDSSSVTLYISGASFAGGGTFVSANASGGVATFSGLVINAANPGYTFTASDPSLSSAVSTPFNITDVPSKLVFQQQPTASSLGVPISPAVRVAVQDPAGGVYTSDSSSVVTLTLSSGTFSTGLTTATATASSGVASFGSLAINNSGSYVLTASDGLLPAATSSTFTVAGTASKLLFLLQPTSVGAGQAITPAVTVSVDDSLGNLVPTDSSTVTLTLSGGTFVGGGTVTTAVASKGIATFSTLPITAQGAYSLSASDSNAALTHATSNVFAVTPAPVSLNFNNAATDFTTPFTVFNVQGSDANSLTWSSTAGIADQSGGASGGAVQSNSGNRVEATAVYTPSVVNLSDGQVHTLSEYVTDNTSNLSGNDKMLQLGLLAPGSTNLNSGFTFLSARLLSNNTAEFQSGDGANGVTAAGNTALSPSVQPGDWLQLVFNVQETAPGSFNGNFSVLDYGQTGIAVPTVALAATPWSVTGLTALGVGNSLSPAVRTSTVSGFSGQLAFDNFYVSPNFATATTINNDTSTAVSYSSGWTSGAFTPATGQAPAYNADSHSTTTSGASATISFTGSEILYYATENTSRGDVNIQLDSNSQLSNYASEYSSNGVGDVLIYDSGPLTYGAHTLKISVGSRVNNQRGIGLDRFDVLEATPKVSWATAASITYGGALSSTQLNATVSYKGATVPGTIVYGQPAGTVLNAGQAQPLTAIFVPTDLVHYSEANASSLITVNPATLTLAIGNQSRVYGAGDSNFNYTVSGLVNNDSTAVISGSPNISSTDGMNSPVGTYSINATAGTLSAANYGFAFTPGTLSVTPDGTTTMVSSTQSPATPGQFYTINATVAPAAPGSLTPSGSVQFMIDGAAFGSPVVLNALGLAGIPVSSLGSGNHQVTAAFTPDTGNFRASNSPTFVQQVQTQISGWSVNAGAAQRSMVTSVTVTFSGPIGTLDAGAFTLQTSTGGAVAATLIPTISPDRLSVTLTFSGSGVTAGSLGDGRYVLMAHASAIHDQAGLTLAADQSFSFLRFFGDINGDATVNLTDYRAFFKAYLSSTPSSAYNAAFDINGDGTINLTDYRAFFKNYLHSI